MDLTSHDIKWNASYPYHWNYSQKSLTYNYLPFLKHANSIANEEKNTSREFLEFACLNIFFFFKIIIYVDYCFFL
ncbi:hypothetical protein T4B_3174 [Trichinella pseudospiralis]|uniref:Uncharacterized protein n=1 Tax=Trichinella pseudospiralis TaxID=6337 RepID=A0A0V1GNW1_TRIPS|nr:hypothetical protein T4B_13478 [Trichinella pseudospiralis]KRY99820.1 hypothetical protein T4B_3174 [Trichinella pseudospiralis]